MLEVDVTCLDDDQVLRALGGGLAGAELIALDVHLDGCAGCRALLGAVALGSDRAPAAASDELRGGEQLGRYVIAHRLGAGAMGVVYAARDPELDRTVALKLLRPERAEDGRRLLREAQAMARLAHPNIVAVHDVGARDALVYVAMERVDGPTLRTWAATRPWADVLEALRAIGRGLAAAHAAGVVHRDVKPDNVLVGADGRPRIGDFGLARADGDRVARADGDRGAGDVAVTVTLTATGAVLGTPVYMAPEQLRGEEATPASDQWSFAVMCWELLLGGRPFAGDDLAALTRSIQAGPPAVRARGPAAAVIGPLRRALSIDPAARFAELGALVAALAPPARARWRWVAGGAAVAAAALAVIAIGRGPAAAPADACADAGASIDPVWSARHPARAAAPAAIRAGLDRIAERWRGARIAVCRGGGDALAGVRAQCLTTRADELAAVIAALGTAGAPGTDGAPGRDGALAAAIAGLADPDECATSPALALLAPIAPEQRPAIDAVQSRLAAARVRAALGARAAALADVEAAIADAERTGHRPTQAAAHLTAAEILRALGRYDDAERAALAAALDAAAGHDDLTAARAWLVRVGIAGDRRDLIHAAEWLPHADAAVERAGRPALLDAQLANSTGLLALNQGRLDDAERALTQALAGRRAIAGADVEVARTLSSLGHVARLRGDLAAARAHHEAALAIDRAHLGDRDVDVGRDLHNLGGVLRLAGDLDAAREAYREALAIRAAALGPDHPEVGLTHNSLGLVALELLHLGEAERELTTALRIFTAAGHLDRAIALANLARVAAARRDPARALALATEAIALDRAQLPARHERLADNLLVAARAAAAGGDRVKARALAADVEAALPESGQARERIAEEARALVAALGTPAARLPRVRMQGAGTESVNGSGADTRAITATPIDAGVRPPAPIDAPLRRPDARPSSGVYGSAQGWD